MSVIIDRGKQGGAGGSTVDWNQRRVVAAATAANHDYLFVDTTANGSFPIAAPTPVANGWWGAKWIAGTVAPTFTGVFSGTPSFVVVGQAFEFISDGATWVQSLRPAMASLPDYTGPYNTQNDFLAHVTPTYHVGGDTHVTWNGVAWPPSRPAGAGMVWIFGAATGAGATPPSWMTTEDKWVIPATAVTSFLAQQNFEAFSAGNPLVAVSGPESQFDIVNVPGTGGASATVVTNTAGGGSLVGHFVVGTVAGTTYGAWRNKVGTLTSYTIGARWINPKVASPFGTNNMQLLRVRRNNAGTYVNAQAFRLNGSTGKFEVTDSAGAVALTSVQAYSVAPAYYDLEIRVDSANSHMEAFLTPAGGSSEVLGDMTTTRSTGPSADEYACGALSSFANVTVDIDWFRIADVNTRVNS